MRIGIDIDGVLNNLEAFQRELGTRFCFERNIPFRFYPDEYKIRNMFQWDRTIEKQFYEAYYALFLTTSRFLRHDAVEVLPLLHKKHTLFLITARIEADVPIFMEQSMSEITQNWLVKNNLCFDKLLFSPPDKRALMEEYHLDLMIEDNPDLLAKASYCNIPFLCFNAAYNQIILPPNVTRIYSWYEILIYLKITE